MPDIKQLIWKNIRLGLYNHIEPKPRGLVTRIATSRQGIITGSERRQVLGLNGLPCLFDGRGHRLCD